MNLKNPTFKEISDEFGQELYEGTTVDDLTKTALLNYFKFSKISDPVKPKWVWMWQRNMNLFYPVYETELSMWKEYRENEWFYDKQKVNNKTHTEMTELTEDVKKELNRNLDRVFNQRYNGTTSQSGTGNNKTNATNETEQTTETNETNNTNGKNRNFNFNYPEANYQGGVIPYDLNNNPSVEFINTQADALNQENQNKNNNTTDNTTQTQEEEQNSTFSNSGTEANTTDQTQNDTETQNDAENRNQNIHNIYTDEYLYDGSNIIDLADKMIDLIQKANFFKNFVNHLERCFVHSYDSDDLDWEDFEYAESL